MLTLLRIRDLGVIGEATLELGPGMIALTGETGAGKTMVTSGLGLLLGQRADAGVVRHDSERAVVEGRFENTDATLDLPALVEGLGGELDGDELLASRQITARGRSRAYVGGSQTTVAALSEVTGLLATIHGQSEQVRLASSTRQRDVLDRACGPEHLASMDAHRALHERRRVVADELDALRRATIERTREAEMLTAALEEIAAVDPQLGEDVALAEEAARLSSLDQLRSLSEDASAALSGVEDAAVDAPGAVGMVGMARRSIRQLAELDATARGLEERTTQLGHLISELAADVASYRADLDADPARLEHVVARQAALAGLTRKYGPTVDDVLVWSRESAQRLLDLEGTDERIGELEGQVERLGAELRASAAQITRRRREGASRLVEQVRQELAALAMPHARLEFDLAPLPEIGPHGAESVTLLFAANPGATPAPLGRTASGGELSRVRLAIEVVLAGTGDHTYVFDEVDAGIGGAVALEVGRRLARLAEHSQVIVVTHLAQVAAFADQHFVVVKTSDGEVTASGVTEVSGAQREAELARMMGGTEGDSARTHARDLLREAQRS